MNWADIEDELEQPKKVYSSWAAALRSNISEDQIGPAARIIDDRESVISSESRATFGSNIIEEKAIRKSCKFCGIEMFFSQKKADDFAKKGWVLPNKCRSCKECKQSFYKH